MRPSSPTSSLPPYVRTSPLYRARLLIFPLLLLSALVYHSIDSATLHAHLHSVPSPSAPLANLLSRLRSSPPHHSSQRPRLSVEQKDGYLFYSDRVPQVTVNIPTGKRLVANLPPRPKPTTARSRHSQTVLGSPRSRRAAPSFDQHLEDEEHPISFLIREAEAKWTEMLERQSKTLTEAVEEYYQRYDRAPPKGFDAWWRYAKENDVVLVDEYDQINTDIEPFLAVEASVLREQVSSIVADGGGYVSPHSVWAIEIQGGTANISRMPPSSQHRAYQYLELIQKFAEWLPDMVIPFSIEDGPSVIASGETKAKHIQAAREGRKLTSEELNEDLSSQGWTYWAAACPPDSPMRRGYSGKLAGATPARASFISDHYEAADLCNSDGKEANLHGTTLLYGQQPGKLFPIVSFSKFNKLHSDILGTPMDQYSHYTPKDVPWQEKTSKVLWRGATTGIWHSKQAMWQSSQRPRLSSITNDDFGERTVLLADHQSDAMRSFTANTADINEFYFDVAHFPQAVQCFDIPGVDETCKHVQESLRFDSKVMTFDEQASFKYLLDVDGNAWSGRFHRLMSTNSLVFKSTMLPEWYSQRIMPWLHYVPIKIDYSDLHNAAVYFIGDAEGFGAHDEQAKRLGAAGKAWAEQHWRPADMAAYQFRLYLELARAMEGVEGSHDYK